MIQLQKNQEIVLKPFGVFRVVLWDLSKLTKEEYEKYSEGSIGLPKSSVLVSDETYHNQVTQVGLNGFAKIANGESGFTGVPNYCALGTGANDPLISDTTLQAEVARSAMLASSNVRTNSSVAMQFYFGPTVANTNIKEVGAFIDGTTTANSGTLFDRALLDITKTSLNSLYIYFTLTFSA